jgi:TolB-like protein/DNA-binding winged helix-turn-helix (wHTH) protein/Tfp pilus assembly protein PilF
MRDASPTVLRLGDGLFNANGSLLADKSGRVIPLRPQSVEVLKALAAQEGTVVSKEDLLAKVWGNVAVTDDSLTQCIADIRRALCDRDHRIVQTVPKKGYRLVADAPPERPHRKRWAMAAVFAVVPPLVLLGAWHVSRTPVEEEGQAQAFIASEVTRAEPSIAVLPFESIENEERWTRLGRGLAADIASELALNDWLYVTVPESLINVAFGSLPEGRLLDVRFALSGTIQAQGDEIRIAAHLTDVSTREVLWSETWTEPQNDIFAVQDRIVSRIGASLASSYSGAVMQADLERAKRKLTGNLNAYEHYLIAFEMYHRFEPANYPEVIRHLETALEIDPDFAGALVTLSVVQEEQAMLAEGAEAQAWLDASQDSAYRAYAIDPNNPNVLWNVARAYALDGQLNIAGKTLRRAVELSPNNADVLMIAAGYSGTVGIAEPEPLSWARRALELNPLAPAWWYANIGEAAFGAGELDLAVETLKRAPPLDPSRWLITALAEAHRGNLATAQKAAQRFRELAPNLTIEEFAGGTEADRPDQHRVFEGARLLGLPVTDAEL